MKPNQTTINPIPKSKTNLEKRQQKNSTKRKQQNQRNQTLRKKIPQFKYKFLSVNQHKK